MDWGLGYATASLYHHWGTELGTKDILKNLLNVFEFFFSPNFGNLSFLCPVSQSCAATRSLKFWWATVYSNLASKVWFLYSHICTFTNGAVFHSVCQVWLSSGLPEFFTFSYMYCAWLWHWLIHYCLTHNKGVARKNSMFVLWDHPGESSPHKDYHWWLTFRLPEW